MSAASPLGPEHVPRRRRVAKVRHRRYRHHVPALKVPRLLRRLHDAPTPFRRIRYVHPSKPAQLRLDLREPTPHRLHVPLVEALVRDELRIKRRRAHHPRRGVDVRKVHVPPLHRRVGSVEPGSRQRILQLAYALRVRPAGVPARVPSERREHRLAPLRPCHLRSAQRAVHGEEERLVFDRRPRGARELAAGRESGSHPAKRLDRIRHELQALVTVRAVEASNEGFVPRGVLGARVAEVERHGGESVGVGAVGGGRR
mmetsp:Transcript_11741/g.47254  ORF Transcript_11741/g.47254 Transcript_11741/m.47254 type:complete len:257 (-) Transcript_11741:460-1230(-)